MSDSVIIYREPAESFSMACGRDRALSLTVAHRDRQQPADLQTFDQPFVRIGRSLHNDLVLPDAAVSFRHLYLQMVDGHWAYFNLHSTVRAKGRRRQPPSWGWLDEAGTLNVGPFAISVPKSEVSSPIEPLWPRHKRSLTTSVTEFELELVNRQNHAPRRIQRPVTLLGSARQCDMWLKDPSVSSVHASLVLTPNGVWVIDLLGRNGVTVDQRRVSWKKLENGSFLEIGKFCFRVWINNADPLTVDPQLRPLPPSAVSSQPMTRESSDNSLSRDFVMGVLHHLVESRTEFFEHLRQQSQLIHELFARLNETRTSPATQELQRLDALDRELAEIKEQLSRLSSERSLPPPIVEPQRIEVERRHDPVTAEFTAEDFSPTPVPKSIPDPTDEAVEPRTEFQESPRPAATTRVPLPRTHQPPGETESSMSVQEVHARLSERMSRLASERTSLLQGMLRRLGLADRR